MKSINDDLHRWRNKRTDVVFRIICGCRDNKMLNKSLVKVSAKFYQMLFTSQYKNSLFPFYSLLPLSWKGEKSLILSVPFFLFHSPLCP